MHATAQMKAPGTLYCIAKGAIAAASLQLVGPSPCTPAPPPRRAADKAPARLSVTVQVRSALHGTPASTRCLRGSTRSGLRRSTLRAPACTAP